MKKLVIIAIALALSSCKKESAEPFGTPTTTDAATDVKTETATTPETLGKELLKGKELVLPVIK